jgi:branched-chain amino acid transport system substrate-binding protein
MYKRIAGKFLVSCLMVCVMVAVISGCAKEEKTYKIGAIFAVTGPAAGLGVPEKNTAEMLMEQINAAGGIGKDKAKLEIVILDTATDPTTARTRVEKLIADDVAAIVGPSTSGESMSILELAQNAQIPLVSCAAAVTIVEPVAERKWVFKTPQSDVLMVTAIADYLKSQNITKVGIITATGGFGQSGKTILEDLLPKAGIEIVQAEEFAEADPDVLVQLSKIKDAEPEAVVCWSIHGGGATVTKDMKVNMAMDIPLIMSHGVANKDYISLSGEAANGVIFPAGKLTVADNLPDSDPQKKLLLDYVKDYKAKFGSEPNTFGGHAWDAIKLVVNAMEKVGDGKAKIRDEIENTKNFVGTGGIFNFSPTDHNGLTKQGVIMVKIVDGEWTFLQ